MIIAIDFDGTIADGAYPGIGEAVPLALETIRDLYREGYTLLLWTCREDKNLMRARLWLNANGVGDCFTAFNENDPERTSRYNNDSRKLGADMYLDDKALGWPGWAAVRKHFNLKERIEGDGN